LATAMPALANIAVTTARIPPLAAMGPQYGLLLAVR
jgi:hypothetical protein